MQDTTNDPIIAQRRPKAYRNYQLSEDYYSAGQLIWLDVDARIRQLSGDRKSLDDFARAFFGVDDGAWQAQKPYTFEDVVATLDRVVADDWTTFLRTRLDGSVPFASSVEAAGWKLVYTDKPSDYAKAMQKDSKGAAEFTYSLGFSVDKDGKLGDVRWDSPAFNAGIGSGMTLVAVNDLDLRQGHARGRRQGGEDRQGADPPAGARVQSLPHDRRRLPRWTALPAPGADRRQTRLPHADIRRQVKRQRRGAVAAPASVILAQAWAPASLPWSSRMASQQVNAQRSIRRLRQRDRFRETGAFIAVRSDLSHAGHVRKNGKSIGMRDGLEAAVHAVDPKMSNRRHALALRSW